MNSKNITVAIALWTLLLAPFFCGLGVVVHACFDDAAAECHHEMQCDEDPCQILVLTSSHRQEEDSSSDQMPDDGATDLLTSAQMIHFSPLITRLSGAESLLLQPVSIQRNLPLIS